MTHRRSQLLRWQIHLAQKGFVAGGVGEGLAVICPRVLLAVDERCIQPLGPLNGCELTAPFVSRRPAQPDRAEIAGTRAVDQTLE